MTDIIVDYNNNWLPDQRGVGNTHAMAVVDVNTAMQQQYTVANRYQPVTAPTLAEEIDTMGLSDIHFQVGGGKEEVAQVANHMRSLVEVTSSFANFYQTTYKALPAIQGLVSKEQFEDALAIYENNQVYYQECIDNQTISQEDITQGLVQLEQWFVALVEPDSIEGASERRLFLQNKGVSAYCDPEIYPYLSTLLTT